MSFSRFPCREVLSVCHNDVGEGVSLYPFALAYPQGDQETFTSIELSREIVRTTCAPEVLGLLNIPTNIRLVRV
jgi:hypothetical protein